MEKLISHIQSHFKDNLVAIYQYGYPVKNATLYLLIILEKVSAADLKPTKLPLDKAPVQLTIFAKSEIAEALDVFPIEFLAMKSTKKLLAGTDILDTPITNHNLRHECEFTLRSTILKLRSAYILNQLPPKDLIIQSVSSLLTVLAGILHMLNIPPANDTHALISTIETNLNISLSAFKTPETADFAIYMDQLLSLSDHIDSLPTS